MTPQYLTGYVQAIVDKWREWNDFDERKELSIDVTERNGVFTIEARYVREIRLAQYYVNDRHDRGMITVHDPEPVYDTDHFRWLPSEGIHKIGKEVEEMIERINKIELE